MTKLTVAIYQMSAAADPATNPDRIIAAMHEAKANGADLLVSPELALSGYGQGDFLREIAQPADGEWAQDLSKHAHAIGIDLVAGFPERAGDDFYISAMALHADGRTPVIYRKSFLYGEYEKALFHNDYVSVATTDIGGIKAGFLICYDVEFPENVRRLAQAGVELVIVPTALPKGQDGQHIASRVIPVRAYENQVFVVYADHADADARFEYQGMSCAFAPDGSALAQADITGEALIYATIDTRAYDQCRARNPYLTDLARMERRASTTHHQKYPK